MYPVITIRRLFFALAVVVLMGGFPVAATAQSNPNADAVFTAWDSLLSASRQNDAERFQQALDALLLRRDLSGMANLEGAGVALAQMASEAMLSNHPVRARQLADAAVAVAPDNPEGYLIHSDLAWRSGDYPASIQWVARAARVGMSHYWVGIAWLGYLAMVLWLAAATTFVVLLLPSLVLGIRTLHHLFQEVSFFRLPLWLTAAGAISIVALPVAAGFGLGWLALTWAVLAWLGDGSRQRRAQLLMLLMVLMGPWLCAPFLSIHEPQKGVVEIALDEGRGTYLTTGMARDDLPDADAVTAGNWRVAFALGNAAYRLADYDGALKWYEQARRLGGDPTRIAHNIATTHFKAGRSIRAEALFKALAEGGDPPVLTLFNLGQAQSQRLDFEAARITFERARQTDPDDYLKVMAVGADRTEAQVVPFAVTHQDKRAILLSEAQGWGPFARSLWQVLFGHIPVLYAPLIMLITVVLFWGLPKLLAAHRVRRCQACDAVMCQACMRYIGELHLCARCGDRLQQTQMTEVDFRMLRDRFRFNRPLPLRFMVSWIPGFPALMAGRYGAAGLQLFGVALLVWWMVLLNGLPEWAIGVPQAGWPATRAVALAVLVVYIGLSALAVRWHRDKAPTVPRRRPEPEAL